MSVGKPAATLGVVLGFCISLAAVETTLALPFEGGKQILDNERVTVWDVLWPADRQVPVQRRALDTVTVALTDGPIRIVDMTGAERTVTRKIGDVQFQPKGSGQREESQGAGIPHDIVIELKDVKVGPLANTSKYPNAFPRPGSKKVLENDRVVAWDYTWTPGLPTPMHFHDKDVVVTYLETGELASTTPDGQVVNNPHYFGFTKWNTRDRSHTETLTKGKGRAVIVELK